MRLADFIRENREVIISEWEAFARTLLAPERKISATVLRDHATGILDAIVEDMSMSQSAEEQASKSKGRGRYGRLGGAGKTHAAQRLERGFRLDQLVGEYRALRASVLRLWAESPGAKSDAVGVTRFNEAIDEALTESTTRYMQSLERHRDQFLGILGHDLRNPLGAIIMGASVLTASEGLDTRCARMGARILHSARRMDRMVDDLLVLTRTRLGAGLPIVRAPVDLASVCRQVVSELHGAHPDAPLQFEAKGDVHGEWDADRLAQVVSNLVGNAVQHGTKNRPVTVVARGVGDEVVLEVHNEGPAIPHSALRSIFEPMIRLGTPDKSKKSGNLGLGLYIVQQVVAAHGGRIGVTSTKAGGTTFVVVLPRHAPAEQHVGPARAAPRAAAAKRRPTTPRRRRAPSRAAPPRHASAAGRARERAGR